MKKLFGLGLAGLAALTLASCNKDSEEVNYVELNDIKLVENTDGDIELDLTASDAIKEKYDALAAELDGVDINKIIVATTSTANMLFEMGITPIGAPASSALNPELAAMQCDAEIDGVDGCTVANIGSAIAPTAEVIVKTDAELVLASSALISMWGDDKIAELYGENANVTSLPQDEIADVFVILQVFNDLAGTDNAAIQETFRSMYDEVEEALSIVASSDIVNPNVALVQAGTTSYTVNNTTVVGSLAMGLGMNNLFGTAASGTTELSAESFIAANPDYIMIYNHSTSGDTTAATSFADTLAASDSVYRTVSAVQNEDYFVTSAFSGSADLNITKILLEMAKGVYQ